MKKRRIIFDKPEVKAINAIEEELRSFSQSIIHNIKPPVTIDDGYQALNVAQMIIDKIDATSDNF